MQLTKEQESISNRNRRKTRKELGIYGNKDLVLHHINPDWEDNDIERYIQWNPEDLKIMTNSEHRALHNSLRTGSNNPNYGKVLSEEWKQKISDTRKGKPNHPQSEETRQKISEARKRYFAERKDLQIK